MPAVVCVVGGGGASSASAEAWGPSQRQQGGNVTGHSRCLPVRPGCQETGSVIPGSLPPPATGHPRLGFKLLSSSRLPAPLL